MDHTWFLPLSIQTWTEMASGEEDSLSNWSQPEIAAAVFLKNLPKLAQQGRSRWDLERVFAKTIQFSHQELLEHLEASRGLNTIGQGIILAAQYGIQFMERQEIESRAYLHPDRSWNLSYGQQRRERSTSHQVVRHDGLLRELSDGQRRLMDAEMAMPDEAIGCPSNAGTGKTTVLYEMVERIAVQKLLPVTVLADQSQKHRPLLQKLGAQKYQTHKNRIHLRTYIHFAIELLSRSNQELSQNFKYALQSPYSAKLLCERAQLADTARVGPDQLAAQSWEIIRRYCNTLDAVISERHISQAKRLHMTRIEAASAVSSAIQVWNTLISFAHPDLPMRGFHIIKLLELSKMTVPEYYGTIMIDELHDAPPVMVEVLQRSGLPLRMLGDRYQNFRGLDLPFSKANTILTCNMNVSLRAGPQVPDYVNPLLDIHPLRATSPYSANSHKATEFHEYPLNGLPDEPTVMPTLDEWGVLALVIRGRQQGRMVDVFDPSDSLGAFISDCKGLLYHGQRAAHGALRRYDSWDTLAQAQAWNPAFESVEKWLKNRKNLELSYGTVSEHQLISRPSHTVAVKLHDIKSFELPAVAIPETLYCLAREGSRQELARTISMLYTAVTRGAQRVHVPNSHRERLACLDR